jgi:hypothetical protein
VLNEYGLNTESLKGMTTAVRLGVGGVVLMCDRVLCCSLCGCLKLLLTFLLPISCVPSVWMMVAMVASSTRAVKHSTTATKTGALQR